jgi:uncharacterized membrane protein
MIKPFLKKVLNLEFTYLFGFALFLSIFYGLLVNSILPLFGISDPLSFKYLVPIYLFFLIPFIKILTVLVKWLSSNFSTWPIKIILILNPLLAVAGVNYLDNTGNGSIAIASVALISIVFIVTLIYVPFRKGITKLSIFSSALSLLLANSYRSHFLVGWDIHQEYYIFQMTSLHNYWDINALRTAYNACLSISILPTMIQNLTGVNPMDIFRVIFPMIIALIPVIVYQIGTRFTSNKISYIGAFLFLIQNQFIAQLPALLRQSIAFLFFALMIDFLVRTKINHKYQKWAILISGVGVIWSHYSTTYIMLLLLITAKIIGVVMNLIWRSKNATKPLSYKIILGLLIIAFSWNVLITDTASGLVLLVQNVFANIGRTFTLENKSDMVKGVFYQQSNNTLAVNNYSNEAIKQFPNKEDFQKYKITPISLDTGKPLLLSDPFPIYFHIIIPWLFRLSIIIGVLNLLIFEIKNRKSSLIVSLCSAMLISVLAIIVLPNISGEYNIERLLQQMLILLAPASALGFYTVFGIIKKFPASIPISIIVLSFMYQSTGFIDHLVYKTSGWMFDNSGESYYRYLTSSEEIGALKWLEIYTPTNTLLYTDKYTKLRLTAYSNQIFSYISNEINPPKIEKFGYTLSGFAATKANVVFADIRGQSLRFSFPNRYLSDNRDLIYSSSGAKIYR